VMLFRSGELERETVRKSKAFWMGSHYLFESAFTAAVARTDVCKDRRDGHEDG
jgi:hypothetical protein